MKSSTGKQPHFVKASKTAGGYIRDEDCISYKSAKICSHTVAVALKCKQVDELVQWCQTLKCKPNLTAIAESGKPSCAGKKHKRKASKKKATQHVREILATADESSLHSYAQLHPPGKPDIVLRRKEYVMYQNSRTGVFEQSKDDRNVYYHAPKVLCCSTFLGLQCCSLHQS